MQSADGKRPLAAQDTATCRQHTRCLAAPCQEVARCVLSHHCKGTRTHSDQLSGIIASTANQYKGNTCDLNCSIVCRSCVTATWSHQRLGLTSDRVSPAIGLPASMLRWSTMAASSRFSWLRNVSGSQPSNEHEQPSHTCGHMNTTSHEIRCTQVSGQMSSSSRAG